MRRAYDDVALILSRRTIKLSCCEVNYSESSSASDSLACAHEFQLIKRSRIDTKRLTATDCKRARCKQSKLNVININRCEHLAAALSLLSHLQEDISIVHCHQRQGVAIFPAKISEPHVATTRFFPRHFLNYSQLAVNHVESLVKKNSNKSR